MRMFYSKAALLALLPAAMGSLHAAESLVQTNVVEDDHAYETVTHLDQQREGYVIEEGWKITGDLRVGLLTYDYSNDPANPDPNINNGHMDSNGIYVVPKLSITSPNYNGFTFKITGAGATDFGINDPLYESRNFVFDPTEKKSFVILQEAYVSYETEDGAHAFLVGAKETVTPMVDADDWYMLADSFQGAYYRNKSFENIMFAGGYFYKMIGVWDSGANGTQWHTMSDASFVDSGYKKIAGDEGIWTGVFQYNDGTHNLQIWDYYMQDYYNFFEAGSLRNTNSYKVQLGYNFEKQGAKGLWIGARYTMFDLDSQYSKNGYGDPQERMNLYGIRVSYNAEGGFYFTGTYEKVDLDAEPSTYSVRLIGGYKF